MAEKKPAYQSQPFTSSNRYFRGRIVNLLSSVPAPQRLTLDALGPQLKPDFSDGDLPWLQRIVDGLVKDGLLNLTHEGVRLP